MLSKSVSLWEVSTPELTWNRQLGDYVERPGHGAWRRGGGAAGRPGGGAANPNFNVEEFTSDGS